MNELSQVFWYEWKSFLSFLILDSSSDHTFKKKSLAKAFIGIISAYSYNATEIMYQLWITGGQRPAAKGTGSLSGVIKTFGLWLWNDYIPAYTS